MLGFINITCYFLNHWFWVIFILIETLKLKIWIDLNILINLESTFILIFSARWKRQKAPTQFKQEVHSNFMFMNDSVVICFRWTIIKFYLFISTKNFIFFFDSIYFELCTSSLGLKTNEIKTAYIILYQNCLKFPIDRKGSPRKFKLLLLICYFINMLFHDSIWSEKH